MEEQKDDSIVEIPVFSLETTEFKLNVKKNHLYVAGAIVLTSIVVMYLLNKSKKG
jgi:hypothetical protein